MNDGQAALEWRIRAIDAATDSIELQSFIWKSDRVGQLIADRLTDAARRGVQVRILIDDSFLAGQDRWVLEIDHHPNIEYRIYNPYKRRTSGTLGRTLLNLSEFARLDHRMHNKVMIVDGQIAIVGGRNLADEYFGLDAEANFRDMELLVGGPIIEELTDSFDEYWNDRWSFPAEALAHVDVGPAPARRSQLASGSYDFGDEATQRQEWVDVVRSAYRGRARLFVDEPPRDRPEASSDRPVQVAQSLYDLLDRAQSEIIIVSAYLIPTPALTEALKSAVERGVSVRMLTNSINSNNHISAHAAYRLHVKELVSLGARVHELRVNAEIRPRYILPPVERKRLGLHAKYLIVDGRDVFVGSSNLDPRSLRINTEVGLLVRDRKLARAMLDLTAPDFERTNSWELVLDDSEKLVWVGHDQVRRSEPATEAFQLLEEWFFAHLPIEQEM